jgi:1-hydroxycarotenoid 3,4-desaturase
VKVVVVGAGLGGLSAALHAAGHGHDVVVVEASSQPGGKAGCVVLDGVEVDTGPSVLTLPQTFDDAFRAVGSRLGEHVELLSEGGRFRYNFHDGSQVDIDPDLAVTRKNVEASFGARAARELDGFLAYAQQIWDSSAPNFVFTDAPSVGSIMRLGFSKLAAVRHLDAWRSMWGAIEGQISDPRLRFLLARYATYNGSNVLTAPATLNCIAHVEMVLGGHGVRGGIGALVRAMVTAAESAGVHFRFGTAVRAIRTERKTVVGVDLADGTSILASAVVANCEASRVPALLGRPERRSTEAPSTSGWNAIVRARRRPERPAHEVVFPEHYLEEFKDLHDRDRAPKDPTVYTCAPEKAHGRTGWAEHEPLFVMANAPALGPADEGPDDWSELEGAVMQRLRGAGLIEDDDEVLWRRNPKELAARFPGSRGAIYGASSNSMWAAFRRPSNRFEGCRGLYLASGTAHPGGGMPLVAMSGRLAVDNLDADIRSGALSR